MIKSIFIKTTLLLLLVFTTSQDNSRLLWSDGYVLEWSDYKAKPDWDNTNVALTATSISFSYGLKKTTDGDVLSFKSEVKSYFYPNKSWYKETSDVPLDDLIEHERVHFDITELFARHFRKRLSELQPSTKIVNQMLKLNDSITNAMNRKHQLYDFETNGGLTRDFQKQWEMEIEEQLNSLSEFTY